MPILVDSLSVWDISFRWAGYDPRKFYFRIPLEAENYARILIDAIHKAELSCESITLEKRQFEEDEKKLSFYYWVDEFFSTTAGVSVSRKLLKWAHVERFDFMQWCQRMNAPLPEFWFPKDWNLEYQINENEYYPGHGYMLNDLSYEERLAYRESIKTTEADQESTSDNLRSNQKIKIACQIVAESIWKTNPNLTIADMIKRTEIANFCGAERFVPAVVRRWLSEVAPLEVKSKRGRPKKK